MRDGMMWRGLGAVAVALLLTGCSADGGVGGAGDDVAADTAAADQVSGEDPGTTPDPGSDPGGVDTGGSDPGGPDPGGPDTPGTPDATPDDGDGPICGLMGDGCEGNDDCCSGFCIEGADGLMCTKTCDASCPDGFDCLNVATSGTDPVSICVPRHVRLCRPCTEDADCEHPLSGEVGRCLPAEDPDEGSFCGSPCSAGAPCPEGYACDSVVVDGGTEVKQCVPADGALCECLPTWAGKGFDTTCAVSSEAGVCEGARTCGPDGLTACDAPEPAVEACNGVDDDCNGTTDDIAALVCENTNEHGSCEGVEVCGAGDVVVCEGPVAAPETCNGVDDDCNGATDDETCDDGLACTVDTCDPGDGCQNVLEEGWCVIEGACVEAGGSNPADLCETCQPAVATNQWSDAEGKACDDGVACTSGDVCTEGVCQGSPYSCDDGLACTQDVCDGAGGCANDVVPNQCLIGGECVDGLEENPANSCQVCNPSAPTQWSAAPSGKLCSDGLACTHSDQCNGSGGCVGTTYSCADGLSCTEDTCDGAGGCIYTSEDSCVIDGKCVAAGTQQPGNPCAECNPDATTKTWSANTGNACNDGNACTKNDACSSGTCLGTTYTCDDNKPCTQDICDGSGGCLNIQEPGTCFIDNQCWTSGAPNPANPCQACVPAASQTSWFNQDGASCNDGDSCTTGDICSGGVCAGTPNEDTFEANDSEGSYHSVANVSDCTDWPGEAESLSATLYPSGDDDWFRFKTTDKTGCDMYPTVELSGLPSDADYDLCAYYECADGGTGIDCEIGSKVTSPGGKPGCCSSKTGSASEMVRLNPSCDCGTFCFDDTGYVTVHVKRKAGALTCEPYTLKWGDD